jgi:hypothetical protein
MTEPEVEAQGPRGAGQDELQVPAEMATAPLPTPEHTAGPADSGQPATAGGAGASSEADIKSEFSAFAHQYIREYINLADQKATFFFTGGTALLAFMYNKNVSARWLKPVMLWDILDTIAFVAMGALAVGAFLALLVVIPRTPGSRRGFLFWEAIAEYETGRQYSDDLWRLSGPSLVQVKAEHCFDLAVVCRRKYRMLRYALWTGAVGLAGALFVFLFL